MRFDFHIIFEKPLTVRLETVSPEALANINTKLDHITMKLSELPALVTTINTKLDEAKNEILAEIAKLKTTDPDISPEGQAALDSLTARANALGDISPALPPVIEP